MNRKKVDIVTVSRFNNQFHCGKCCQEVRMKKDKGEGAVDNMICDCDLQKIPLYIEYERGAKDFAFECNTCGTINKRI